MLELLARYAQDHGLDPEPGFKPKEIRWAIVCDANANFLEVVELGDTSLRRNPGQVFSKCPDLSFSELVGGKEVKSHFLVDTAEVVALHGRNTADPKVRAKHNAFVELLRQAGKAVTQLTRLADHLENPAVLQRIQARLEAQKAKPTDKTTFKIGDSFPVETSLWHDWWRAYRAGLSGAQHGAKEAKKGSMKPAGKRDRAVTPVPFVRCFVTGELTEPARTQPKIEGLADVGGQGAGTTLIGFDKEAFCSFGFSQAFNAAVSEKSADAYRAALNDLIKNHSRRLAGTRVLHWFKEAVPPENDPLAWLVETEAQQERSAQQRARELLESIRSGRVPSLAQNYYYALTLSGSGGRVMVRDWMEGQFEELVGNISGWFDDLAIVHRDGSMLAPTPKFLAVLGSVVRDLDDLAAPFVARMWRVAVHCELIPGSAVAQALHRIRVGFMQDEVPNHARMGLLRAYHVRKARIKGGWTMTQDLQPYLNEEHPHAAYHCGRLVAVFAGLQRAALGDVGAGVVQRYYAAASSTPALVLGRLTRTSQFHVNKLEGGLAYWYENKIAGIWGRIRDVIPATLNLEEQSLFALGYYQQMADLRTKKSSNTANEGEVVNE